MSADYYWTTDRRLARGGWAYGQVWRESSRTWGPMVELGLGMERPVSEQAALRYMLTGIEPTSPDFAGRRPLTIAEAEAAADALAEENWPGMEDVRRILADYVEQFDVGAEGDGELLPDDPDPGEES